MKARPWLASLVVAAVMGLALPAGAKGMVTLTVMGPRLDEPIRLTGFEWPGGLTADWKAASPAALGLRAEDLGSKYWAVYTFDFPGSTSEEEIRIRQEIYPYAEGGAVTYTPPGQRMRGPHGRLPFTEGWLRAAPGFLEALVEHGLPEPPSPTGGMGRDPDLAPPVPERLAPETLGDGPPGSQARWAWMAAVGGVLGLGALAAGIRQVRRRESRSIGA